MGFKGYLFLNLFSYFFVGSLLYTIASALPETIVSFKRLLSEYVASNKILSSHQLQLAIAYLKKNSQLETIDLAEFDKHCGVKKLKKL